MTDLAQISRDIHPSSCLGEGLGQGDRQAVAGFKPATTVLVSQNANLILIGVVHGDPRGYARAWRLLTQVRPDLITVEISRFSLRYRQRQGARWQRLLHEALRELPDEAAAHLAIRRLMAQVTLPFEVRVARDWGQRHGVPWRPVDLGGPARRHLRRYGRELLSPDNLRALLATGDGSLAALVTGEFHRARLVYRRGARRLPLLSDTETGTRERFLARRLRRLAGRHRRVAHLGGWEHLVPWEDGRGLWHEVASLNPLRLLLDEADRLPADELAPPRSSCL